MESRMNEDDAIRNEIAAMKVKIADTERRIAGLRELQKYATEDLSGKIGLLEAELLPYRTVLEDMEARLQELES
jgi:uncharacterized protein YeeX (DUF496 family)